MTDASLSLEDCAIPPLSIAPARVIRGTKMQGAAATAVARLGQRPLIVGGDQTAAIGQTYFQAAELSLASTSYGKQCSETSLAHLRQTAEQHRADVVIGVGGGKALDAAKLLGHQLQIPVATLPTSGATCAAWTALSNIYSDRGAFLYDVPLDRCPELLILDYDLIATASQRTLIAGIGDALAKWYEASISSGQSERTLIVAAVQQARVLRDLLLQKSVMALQSPGSSVWQDVVDATVLLAGAIGGLGGAQCRTVAAHAVHNGLTHVLQSGGMLHGEKVAYGILVQLRLEEMVQGNRLAQTARQQLLKFYREIGLPCSLADLHLLNVSLADLQRSAEVACAPQSDIHRLPFAVTPTQLLAAMVSTADLLNPSETDRPQPFSEVLQ